MRQGEYSPADQPIHVVHNVDQDAAQCKRCLTFAKMLALPILFLTRFLAFPEGHPLCCTGLIGERVSIILWMLFSLRKQRILLELSAQPLLHVLLLAAAGVGLHNCAFPCMLSTRSHNAFCCPDNPGAALKEHRSRCL